MAARHLERSVPMLLSLSLCGLSLAGADVAGFMGDPDLELFVRWHQLGIWPPGITWCYLGMVGSIEIHIQAAQHGNVHKMVMVIDVAGSCIKIGDLSR